jgi:hypothetical protein
MPMPPEPYPITDVHPDWVLEQEQLGSKVKFWYRESEGENSWLFKYPQHNTGQHWAEKIAAEIAGRMGVLHATVELAEFQGDKGTATESFARGGRELYHGNQILAGMVLNYDPKEKFRQSDHTLANVLLALDNTFTREDAARRAKEQMADYLVLDALIGNTDRHHENWGILRKRAGEDWTRVLAPSFDHASALGRELLDTGSAKSREQLLATDGIGNYVERGRGGIYWSREDNRGPSPLQLVRHATDEYPAFFGQALNKTKGLEARAFQEIIERIPEDWMTPTARRFVLTLLMYNLHELGKLLP